MNRRIHALEIVCDRSFVIVRVLVYVIMRDGLEWSGVGQVGRTHAVLYI